MRRAEDWPKRLTEYIEARRYAPFAWGANDCAHFAFGAVLAITGTSSNAWVALPAYSTYAGAVRQLSAITLDEWVDGFLGTRLEYPRLAQRGDVVMHSSVAADSGFDSALAICYGPGYCAPTIGDGGLVFSPSMDGALVAWRV